MSHITRAELDQHMMALDLYREGRTIHEVAHQMGETPWRVEKWLTAFRIVRRCVECGILIEPYDPDDAEQQAWGNGTQDGAHCMACAERIRQGARGVRCLR